MAKILSIIISIIIAVWILRLALSLIGGLIGMGFSLILLLGLGYVLWRIWQEMD